MMTATADITLLHSETVELERTVLANALGLLRSLRAGEILPAEAEAQLFTPATSCDLAERGVSADIIAFLEKGYFLEDVQGIIGETQLQNTIEDMEAMAVKLLERRSPKKFCAWTMAKKESFSRKLANISFVLPRLSAE